MTRKPDELRTRRALKALDQAARDYPEAFAPDRLPTTPTALAAALGEKRKVGRPPVDDPKASIGIRFPASVLDAIDSARGDRSRQEVVREAVAKWLKAVKRQPRAR